MSTATATKTTKGFKVGCPYCQGEDAVISLDVNNVKELTCSGCDESFTPADAVAKLTAELTRWQAVQRWVEAAGEFAGE